MAAAIATAAAVLPARAQPDGGPVDTTTAEMIMEAISPKYQTSYNVTRQRTEWEQKLDFGVPLKGWTLNSSTRFKIGNDNQRDSHTRDGGTNGTLRGRTLLNLPLSFDFRINRTSVDQPSVRTENNSGDFTLSTKNTRTLLGIRHILDFRGGLNTRNSLSATAARESENRETGFRGHGEWRGRWTPRDNFSVESAYSEERTRSQAELQESTVDTVRSEDTSRNSRNLRFNVDYDPYRWVTSQLAYVNGTAEEEFFLVQSGTGELEKKVSENERLSLNMAFKPRPNLELTWGMSADNTLQRHQVRDDRSSEGDGSQWEAAFKTKVWGTDVESKLSRQRKFINPQISLGHETIFKVWEGRFVRKLSQRLDGRVNYEVRLRQQFFEGGPDEIQDADELKTKYDTGLNYTPPGKWSASVSYINENTNKIEANGLRASETNDEENHTVTIGIKYAMSARTSITQNYAIQAAYTTFMWDDSRNRLDRTQRIGTSVSSQLTPKIHITMTHDYNLIDSGPFRIEEGGGRRFARSSRSYRQDMQFALDYVVWSWLTLIANERFTRNDRVAEATGATTVRKNLELTQGFRIQRVLGGGVAVRADGAFVRSSTTDSYFSLTSSLNKDF
jgi:hypothetical protein